MEQLKSWEVKKKVFAIIGILSALLIVANIFIPFFSGDLSSIIKTLKIESKEIFGVYSNGISLMGFATSCIYVVNELGDIIGSMKGVFIAVAVLFGVIALFSLINLIAAICKKPVLSMVFSIFIFLFAFAELVFFASSDLLKGTGYSMGPALYIYIVCFVVTFVVDILLIVAKRKIKKIKKENNIS